MPEQRYRSARVIGLLAMIPFILGASPLVGYGLGYLLDRWLHTGQLLRFLLLGLGFAAGVRETARLIKRAQQETERP